MSVVQMREVLRGLYTSVSWRQKVSKMSDKQVIGIYYSMLREGKLGKGGRFVC